MKKSLLILSILLLTINCKIQAQETVPIEDYYSFISSHNEIPSGTYFKDVNHVLPKFEGTWTGS